MSIRNRLSALGLAGALALGATMAAAGPLPVGTATVKDAVGGNYTDIRWRGHGIGPGIAFGLAAGALVGAAVAARPYGYYGYGPGYYYDAPVYAAPYGYAPAYPAYGYRYGGCYTDEGYGRVQSCDR